MSLHLTMLGTFEVRRAGVAIHDFRTQNTRLLLAYLALEFDRPHEREHLASLFWPDAPSDQALTSLRQTLHRLRQALESDGGESTILLISRQTVQLGPSAIKYLDTAAFSAAIAATRLHQHRAAHLCRICARQLQAALALYRGELLAGFSASDSSPLNEWLLQQRERLHGELTFALETLAAHEQRRGDNHQAAVYLRRWLALEPWCEDAHSQLMRVLDAAGRRSAALRQFARCRAELAREIGVEPAEQTIQLAEQIRHRRPRAEHGTPGSELPAPALRLECATPRTPAAPSLAASTSWISLPSGWPTRTAAC
jgi:DNA-binding SARP family transcriptional activator